MKKILFSIILIMATNISFADEKIDFQISELMKEGNLRIDDKQRIIETLKKIEERLIEINGAIKALNQLKDSYKKEDESSKDKGSK